MRDAGPPTDLEVLIRAANDGRVLITHDRHFGRQIFRDGKPAPAGVIYIPPTAWGLNNSTESVLALVEDPDTPVEGFYVTLERGFVRRRPLPQAR